MQVRIRAHILPLAIAFTALLVLVGVTQGGSGMKSWTDPDKGLTEDEAKAQAQRVSDDFFGRLPGWIETTRQSITDPDILERYPMSISLAPPAADLQSALQNASVVVDARVEGLVFRTSLDTAVTFRINRLLYGGRTSDLVTVIYPGGLRPWPDWDRAAIAYAEGAPIPRAGERLILFLRTTGGGGDFAVAPWSGQFSVDADGLLHPLEGNPWGSLYAGAPADVLGAAILVASNPD